MLASIKKPLALLAAVALAAVSAVSSAKSSEEVWPSRVIRLTIPFPAGGATDIVGRTIAQELSVRIELE